MPIQESDLKRMSQKTGIETGIFDNFTLDCFRNCHKYYDWRIVKQLIKPGASMNGANFGSCIHSALEHYYLNGMTDDSIIHAYEVFAEEYKKYPNLQGDTLRTLSKGLDILLKYFARYRHEQFNVIEAEIGGACELGPYLYTVRIDLLLEWISPSGIYGMDHKTSSWLNRLVPKPNNQFTGYDYFLYQTYGSQLLGYIQNGIGVYKTDKERDKATGKMVERNIFSRVITSRSEKALEDWKQETIHLIHQIEDCQEKDIWPKFTHHCSAFSGCQYKDLCNAEDNDIWIPLVESGIYEKQIWTPYKLDGEEGEVE